MNLIYNLVGFALKLKTFLSVYRCDKHNYRIMSSITEFQFLQNPIKDVANKLQFESNYKVTAKNGTKKGDGFLGEIYFVTIQDSKKSVEIVAKSSLKNEKVRETFAIKEVYGNEIYFYSVIHPTLKKFEQETGTLQTLNVVPKYYAHSSEDGAETVCLENLVLEGFEVFDKQSLFDEEHMKMVFDNYAHFHALSFAYKDQKPKEFDTLISKIHDIWKVMSLDAFILTMNVAVKDIIEYLKINGDVKAVEKLNKYAENTSELFNDIINKTTKYNCILHGDCWTNNMMFKYEKKNGKKELVDMKLLDFQILFYASPARDLTYAFYSSASKDVYDKKDEFLNFYYKKFSKYVKELGSDPNIVYPYESLKEEFNNYTTFGFLWGLIINKLKTTDSSDVRDLNELTQENSHFLPGNFDREEFGKRGTNLVKHFYNQNLL